MGGLPALTPCGLRQLKKALGVLVRADVPIGKPTELKRAKVFASVTKI